MSAIFQPTGLRIQRGDSASAYAGGYQQYALTTNNTLAIFEGDTVGLVGGSVVAVTANAVAGTLSANTPVGVVMGFVYQDPNTPGRALVNSQYLPANAVSSLGYTSIFALVADDPNAKFVVQANGPVTQAQIGGAATLVTASYNTGSLPNKTSRLALDASSIVETTNTLLFKIVGFDKNTDTAAGDAFTKVIVRWNAGAHYWSQVNAH